ncbi:MAG TPA: c-type cytochrome [Vicinamibacterales bacterium]
MRTIFAAGIALCLAVAVNTAATPRSQRGPQPEAPPDSPSWAYGVPNTPVQRPPGERPAPDTSLKHIPGSPQGMTLQHIRDYWDVGDWFPDDHPPMPSVIVHGRQPHVRGCAMCHMPNGKGRPENAPVSGQPAAYIVQQLHDFKNGLRGSADPRKQNTLQMIEGAQDMTEDEIQDAAKYFSSMKWTHWITVKEAATVPKTRISGNVFFPLPGAETEPIGSRIIEMPEDGDRFELRDPHSGFIAYVPPGSIDKGSVIVSSGGGKTTPCRVCHGPDLMGLGPVPAIAGRSPSYLMRQLWDFKKGTRHGEWSPLMQQVVKDLTLEDMLDLAAYLAAAGPTP